MNKKTNSVPEGQQKQVIRRSTECMLTRESLCTLLAYLYEAETTSDLEAVEHFSQAVCDVFSDTHDDRSSVKFYLVYYLGRKGFHPPKSARELGELAEEIDDHVAAAEYLGFNRND